MKEFKLPPTKDFEFAIERYSAPKCTTNELLLLLEESIKSGFKETSINVKYVNSRLLRDDGISSNNNDRAPTNRFTFAEVTFTLSEDLIYSFYRPLIEQTFTYHKPSKQELYVFAFSRAFDSVNTTNENRNKIDFATIWDALLSSKTPLGYCRSIITGNKLSEAQLNSIPPVSASFLEFGRTLMHLSGQGSLRLISKFDTLHYKSLLDLYSSNNANPSNLIAFLEGSTKEQIATIPAARIGAFTTLFASRVTESVVSKFSIPQIFALARHITLDGLSDGKVLYTLLTPNQIRSITVTQFLNFSLLARDWLVKNHFEILQGSIIATFSERELTESTGGSHLFRLLNGSQVAKLTGEQLAFKFYSTQIFKVLYIPEQIRALTISQLTTKINGNELYKQLSTNQLRFISAAQIKSLPAEDKKYFLTSLYYVLSEDIIQTLTATDLLYMFEGKSLIEKINHSQASAITGKQFESLNVASQISLITNHSNWLSSDAIGKVNLSIFNSLTQSDKLNLLRQRIKDISPILLNSIDSKLLASVTDIKLLLQSYNAEQVALLSRTRADGNKDSFSSLQINFAGIDKPYELLTPNQILEFLNPLNSLASSSIHLKDYFFNKLFSTESIHSLMGNTLSGEKPDKDEISRVNALATLIKSIDGNLFYSLGEKAKFNLVCIGYKYLSSNLIASLHFIHLQSRFDPMLQANKHWNQYLEDTTKPFHSEYNYDKGDRESESLLDFLSTEQLNAITTDQFLSLSTEQREFLIKAVGSTNKNIFQERQFATLVADPKHPGDFYVVADRLSSAEIKNLSRTQLSDISSSKDPYGVFAIILGNLTLDQLRYELSSGSILNSTFNYAKFKFDQFASLERKERSIVLNNNYKTISSHILSAIDGEDFVSLSETSRDWILNNASDLLTLFSALTVDQFKALSSSTQLNVLNNYYSSLSYAIIESLSQTTFKLLSQDLQLWYIENNFAYLNNEVVSNISHPIFSSLNLEARTWIIINKHSILDSSILSSLDESMLLLLIDRKPLYQYLSPSTIGLLSSAQLEMLVDGKTLLQRLDQKQIVGLTKDQLISFLHKLTPSQVGALSTDQLLAIRPNSTSRIPPTIIFNMLTPDQVSGLSIRQLLSLSSNIPLFKTLSPAQLVGVTADQFKNISPDNQLWLINNRLNHLGKDIIAAFSPSHITLLINGIPLFKNLNAIQISGLTMSQLSLVYGGMPVYNQLTSTQVSGLTSFQLNSKIGTRALITIINSTQLNLLNLNQFLGLNFSSQLFVVNNNHSTLSLSIVSGLTPGLMKAISPTARSFLINSRYSSLDTRVIDTISSTEFKMLGTISKKWIISNRYANLSRDIIGVLTPNEFCILVNGKALYYYLSLDQISGITPAQFKDFDIRSRFFIITARLSSLSADIIGLFTPLEFMILADGGLSVYKSLSNTQISGITPEQFNNFSVDTQYWIISNKCTYLNVFIIPILRSDHLSLSVETSALFQLLSANQVSYLTAKQLASFVFNQPLFQLLSEEQFAGITADQFNGFSKTAKEWSIINRHSYLDNKIIGLLNISEIQTSINGTPLYQLLTIYQVAGLSALQLESISFNNIPFIQLLSEEQFASISAPQFRNLRSDTVTWIITNRYKSIDVSCIKLLTDKHLQIRLNGNLFYELLTATQVSGLSISQLNYNIFNLPLYQLLNPVQIAGITIDQFSGFNLSAKSNIIINRLGILSNEIISSITSQEFSSFSNSVVNKLVSVEYLGALNPSVIPQLTMLSLQNICRMGIQHQIKGSQIAALTTQQLEFLVGYFTDSQIASITSSQLASFSTLTKQINSPAISFLNNHQISLLNALQLTSSVLSSMRMDQVQYISRSAISSMNYDTLSEIMHMLTSEQMSGIVSTETLLAVSKSGNLNTFAAGIINLSIDQLETLQQSLYQQASIVDYSLSKSVSLSKGIFNSSFSTLSENYNLSSILTTSMKDYSVAADLLSYSSFSLAQSPNDFDRQRYNNIINELTTTFNDVKDNPSSLNYFLKLALLALELDVKSSYHKWTITPQKYIDNPIILNKKVDDQNTADLLDAAITLSGKFYSYTSEAVRSASKDGSKLDEKFAYNVSRLGLSAIGAFSQLIPFLSASSTYAGNFTFNYFMSASASIVSIIQATQSTRSNAPLSPLALSTVVSQGAAGLLSLTRGFARAAGESTLSNLRENLALNVSYLDDLVPRIESAHQNVQYLTNIANGSILSLQDASQLLTAATQRLKDASTSMMREFGSQGLRYTVPTTLDDFNYRFDPVDAENILNAGTQQFKDYVASQDNLLKAYRDARDLLEVAYKNRSIEANASSISANQSMEITEALELQKRATERAIDDLKAAELVAKENMFIFSQSLGLALAVIATVNPTAFMGAQSLIDQSNSAASDARFYKMDGDSSNADALTILADYYRKSGVMAYGGAAVNSISGLFQATASGAALIGGMTSMAALAPTAVGTVMLLITSLAQMVTAFMNLKHREDNGIKIGDVKKSVSESLLSGFSKEVKSMLSSLNIIENLDKGLVTRYALLGGMTLSSIQATLGINASRGFAGRSIFSEMYSYSSDNFSQIFSKGSNNDIIAGNGQSFLAASTQQYFDLSEYVDTTTYNGATSNNPIVTSIVFVNPLTIPVSEVRQSEIVGKHSETTQYLDRNTSGVTLNVAKAGMSTNQLVTINLTNLIANYISGVTDIPRFDFWTMIKMNSMGLTQKVINLSYRLLLGNAQYYIIAGVQNTSYENAETNSASGHTTIDYNYINKLEDSSITSMAGTSALSVNKILSSKVEYFQENSFNTTSASVASTGSEKGVYIGFTTVTNTGINKLVNPYDIIMANSNVRNIISSNGSSNILSGYGGMALQIGNSSVLVTKNSARFNNGRLMSVDDRLRNIVPELLVYQGYSSLVQNTSTGKMQIKSKLTGNVTTMISNVLNFNSILFSVSSDNNDLSIINTESGLSVSIFDFFSNFSLQTIKIASAGIIQTISGTSLWNSVNSAVSSALVNAAKYSIQASATVTSAASLIYNNIKQANNIIGNKTSRLGSGIASLVGGSFNKSEILTTANGIVASNNQYRKSVSISSSDTFSGSLDHNTVLDYSSITPSTLNDYFAIDFSGYGSGVARKGVYSSPSLQDVRGVDTFTGISQIHAANVNSTFTNIVGDIDFAVSDSKVNIFALGSLNANIGISMNGADLDFTATSASTGQIIIKAPLGESKLHAAIDQFGNGILQILGNGISSTIILYHFYNVYTGKADTSIYKGLKLYTSNASDKYLNGAALDKFIQAQATYAGNNPTFSAHQVSANFSVADYMISANI